MRETNKNMKRRDTLKAISLSSFGLAALPTSAMVPEAPTPTPKVFKPGPGRTAEELVRDKMLSQQVFFKPDELVTLGILCDIIVPADKVSGSATQAGVPAFIEFMCNDTPSNQTPLRGGLRWLDNYSTKLFGKRFSAITPAQRIEIVDQIAYPEDAKPEVSQGVAFFSKVRDLTVTGFYTTQMGFKDLDYKGNTPNAWDGVPQDVLDKYGLKYDPIYFNKE